MICRSITRAVNWNDVRLASKLLATAPAAAEHLLLENEGLVVLRPAVVFRRQCEDLQQRRIER
eukprot:4214789-Pyramimonas_sp.AAC.1